MPNTPRRRWRDGLEEDDEGYLVPPLLEERLPFRDRRADESEEAYNLARVDAKVELSLRRSHQLHTGLSAVFNNGEVLRAALLGDPSIPNSIGAIGTLSNQVATVVAQVSTLAIGQELLPARINEAVTAKSTAHDAEQFRSLKRWMVTGVGTVIIAAITAAAIFLLHLK